MLRRYHEFSKLFPLTPAQIVSPKNHNQITFSLLLQWMQYELHISESYPVDLNHRKLRVRVSEASQEKTNLNILSLPFPRFQSYQHPSSRFLVLV